MDFLLGSDLTPFDIPVTVHVALLGLSGSGHLGYTAAAASLQAMLSHALPARIPALLDAAGDTELGVEYQLSYRVTSLPAALLDDVEAALADAVERSDVESTLLSGTLDSFDVDAGAVEAAFDAVYEAHARIVAANNARSGDDGARAAAPVHTIIVVAPDKRRLLEAVPAHMLIDDGATARAAFGDDVGDGAGFQYRYTYGAGGGFTQAWVSAGRYMVLDLSAGPCQFGSAHAGEGTVSQHTVPRVTPSLVARDGTDGRHLAFLAQLSTVVLSGVQAVMAPDVARTRAHGHLALARSGAGVGTGSGSGGGNAVTHAAVGAPPPRSIVVAVVALRDHDLFDPMEPGGPSSLDLAAVRDFADSLRLPGQSVSVVSASHSLNDHPHLAVALVKARRTDTVYAPDRSGRYRPVHRPCVRAAALREALASTADELAAFVTRGDAAEAPWPTAKGGRGRWRTTAASGGGSDVLVVPVYVLSLRRWGTEEEETAGDVAAPGMVVREPLLFDDDSMVTVASGVVLAMQPSPADHELPFVADASLVQPFPSDITRLVIAGISTAVAGVASPHTRWSDVHARRVTDYTWAGPGAHPFGPFATHAGLSDLMLDVGRRSAVVARLGAALAMARAAVADIDAFAHDHVFDPALRDESPRAAAARGAAGAHSGSGKRARRVWVDRLFHMPGVMSPLNDTSVAHIHDELGALAAIFHGAAADAARGAFDAAASKAGSCMDRSARLIAFVAEDTARTRERLACCRPAHSTKRSEVGSAAWVAALSLCAVALVAVSRFAATSPPKTHRE